MVTVQLKSSKSRRNELEAIVLPLNLLSDKALKTESIRKWPKMARDRLRAKIKSTVATPKRKADKAHSFSLALSVDREAVVLFLNDSGEDSVDAFTLHSEMRKAFAEYVTSGIEETRKSAFTVELFLKNLSLEKQTQVASAFAFLSQTTGWKPRSFGEKAKQKETPRLIELHVTSEQPLDSVCREAVLRGEANNLVRTLAELPANELSPVQYKKFVQKYAEDQKLSFKYLNTSELGKLKAGAFLAVTRADPQSSAGIAEITYSPTGSSGKSTENFSIALVGKGICFDTGGYNLKQGSSMLGMHGDMTGSALALALCGYFARIRAPFRVTAYLAIAENLISPTAYKPNEVVVALNGKSIEVVDTDAEGRMVLADALALADREKPNLILDFATLTYAAMKSIGSRRGVIFSRDSKTMELALESGIRSGERCWSFPMGDDYEEDLESKIADLLQCSSSELADHIYAATFLSHFVKEKTPWVHMDLASSVHKGGLGLIGTDTTGFGVQWAAQFISDYFKTQRSSRTPLPPSSRRASRG